MLVAVAVLVVAACGGSGSSTSKTEQSVPPDAVALVAGTPVPRTAFDRFFAQTESAYKAQGAQFPKTGTQGYELLKAEAVDLLVQRIEFQKEADLLGVAVTDAEVEKRLGELKDQYFQGDEAKYQEELKKTSLTDADVRDNLRANLLSQKLFDEVTKNVTVSDADLQKYYNDHKDAFTTPASRDVAHILVDTQAKADELYKQLQGGADFAKLAEANSKDTASAKVGGKLTAHQDGSLVAPFEKVAFELKTGEISQPVQTQYGWHIIKALTDTVPAVVDPFEKVKDTVKQQALQEKKNTTMTDWVTQARAKYVGRVSYAVGFEPPVSTTTTGTTSTSP